MRNCFRILLLFCSGVILFTNRVHSQTPDYWIHFPGTTGVNNTFFHGGICQKFLFSYTAAEWSGVGLPPAIPYEIQSIWFRSNTPGTFSYTDIKIQLGHTSLATPVADFALNFDLGGPTTCLDEPLLAVDFVAGPFAIVSDGWTKIDLTTPFIYNGSDNLAVLIEFTGASPFGVPLYGDLSTSTCRYSDMASATTGPNLTWRPMFGISSPDLPPIADFLTSADSVCVNGCVELTNLSSGSPTTYTWSFPGSLTPGWSGPIPPSICYDTEGIFPIELVVSNSFGSDTARGQVTVVGSEQPDLGTDFSFCEGQSVWLSPEDPVSNPIWSTGLSADSIAINTGGIFWLESAGFCPLRDTIVLTQLDLPQPDLGLPLQEICAGDTLILDAGPPEYTYIWSNGFTGSELLVTETGTYTVQADNAGCTASDAVAVDVFPCGCTLTIPNAFTPNQDGLNDQFRPVGSCAAEQFQMQVWNRWGELIFLSQDPSIGWDGTFRGKGLETGAYVWHVEIRYRDGAKIRDRQRQGSVTLIR